MTTQLPLDDTTQASATDRARALREQAVEHARAAMLAEFNGTYDVARQHREEAQRLQRAAARVQVEGRGTLG